MRKTKIICTIGPKSNSLESLEKLMLTGMDSARINFSHGDYNSHKEIIDKIKKVREKLKLPVSILLDTKGPEIRLGDFENNKIYLEKDDEIILTTENVLGNNKKFNVNYKNFVKDLKESFPNYKEEENKILIDDGLIELKIKEIKEDEVICIVDNEGYVSNKKGINVPGCNISMPFISKQDKEDLIFGIEQGVDFVAVSFTRNKEDILAIREVLNNNGGKHINVIAKIEDSQGIENLEDITDVSDGIMIARGDMGVEIPFENLPAIQKKIIQNVMNSGKIVITATQMLQSMMENPRPTRAETSDVANAIYDGTGAIMLSGETAAGEYPIESLQAMVSIAKQAEEDINYNKRFSNYINYEGDDITSAISRSTCSTAIDLDAKAIITITATGRTARMVSRYRPHAPILCFSVDETVRRRMSLVWGVKPLFVPIKLWGLSTEALFEVAVSTAYGAGCVKQDDVVVLTAGIPLGGQGTTNIIKVQIVGE